MNASSSLLSFFIALKVMSMFSSFMPTSMMSGMWSEGRRMSGLRVCLLKPGLFGFMNTRSRTELVSRWLSANLVGPGFIGVASLRSRCHKLHSAITPRILARFPRSRMRRKALKKTF